MGKAAAPNFTHEEISDLLKEHYGIEGTLKPLVSYDDQNMRVTTQDGRFVLKISNISDDPNFIAFQQQVLKHMQSAAPDLLLPRVVNTLNGEDIIMVQHGDHEHMVRMLTYLEGDIFEGVAKSEALYENLGAFMGNFSVAIEGFSSDIQYTPNEEWNLDNGGQIRAQIFAISNQDNRVFIDKLFERYEAVTVPRIQGLRTAVLHQDANEFNLLVDRDDKTQVSGLIDFGDVLEGRQINELAITVAYAMITYDDPMVAASAVVRGYVSKFPITEAEAAVVIDLAMLRLMVSITLGSARALEFPDNAYLTASQKPAYRTLRQLVMLSDEDREAAMIAAAGF